MRITAAKVLLATSVTFLLMSGSECQLNLANDNTFGLSPNLGFEGSELQSTSTAIVESNVQIQIQEDRNDIPKIDTLFLDLCQDVQKLTNSGTISSTLFNSRIRTFCEVCVANGGNEIKNEDLALVMIKYVGSMVMQESFDINLGDDHISTRAREVNGKLINALRDNKQRCWDNPDNCGLTQAMLSITNAANWSSNWNKAKARVVEYTTKVKQAQLSRRRMLFTFFYNAGPRPSYFYDNSKLRVKENVRVTINRINGVYRKYNTFSSTTRAKITKNLSINLNCAKKRCEKVWGVGRCKRMNNLAYCFDCLNHYETYWKTNLVCGCRKTRRLLSTTVDLTALLNFLDSIENNNVDNSYFYQVEDYYQGNC